jgi:hypothetical protein
VMLGGGLAPRIAIAAREASVFLLLTIASS